MCRTPAHPTVYELPRCGVAKDKTCSPTLLALLWEEFFRDPSEWWDNRNTKLNPRNPDFKHKVTGEPLWMLSSTNPSWVEAELRSRRFIKEPCHVPTSTAQIESILISLRTCTRYKDLVEGTRIHHALVPLRLLEKCSDALVIMYAKCGVLGTAKVLLDMHKSTSVIAWTALIAGYVHAGQGQTALACYEAMQLEGVLPNAVTYVCVLKACATVRALSRGKDIHDEITRQGWLQSDVILGGALVDMYAKCGAVLQAQQALGELPSPNLVCWSALIAGCAQEGKSEQALKCFEQMQHEGILPNAVTFTCTLKACASIRAGQQIHAKIARQGLLPKNDSLWGALVSMYAKCKAVPEARQVLEEIRMGILSPGMQ